MDSETTLLTLIDLIYRAAGDTERRGSRTLIYYAGTACGCSSRQGRNHSSSRQQLSGKQLFDLELRSYRALYMTCYGYRNPFMTTRPQVIRSGALLIPQNQGEVEFLHEVAGMSLCRLHAAT